MEENFASVSQLVHSLQVCSDGKPLTTGPQPSSHSIKKLLMPKSPGHIDGTSDKGDSCARTDASLWKPKGGSSAAQSRANLTCPKTVFSEAQVQELEKSFHQSQYPDASQRERLSEVLNVTPAQVKCWFQNRRMKYKHQMLHGEADMLLSNYSAPYYPYPNMYAPYAWPGLKYNVASHPEGSVLQMHPALLNPAWPMPQFLPMFPPFGYNTTFQLSSPSAFSPYQGGYPRNRLMPD